MAASGLYYYAHFTMNKMNKSIRQNIHIIDDILSLIISPDEKKYSMEELIAKYKYPNEDLKTIDWEWA